MSGTPTASSGAAKPAADAARGGGASKAAADELIRHFVQQYKNV